MSSLRYGKALLWFALLGLPTSASAQTVESVLETGSTILGIGAMTTLDLVHVNDTKMWTALIDTGFSDQNQDGVVLRSGFATFREGMFFSSPAGSFLDEIESININRQGNIAMAVKARVPGVSSAKQAIAFNLRFVAVAGDPFISPFAVGTVFDQIEFVKLNDNNLLLAKGKIRPATGGAARDFMMKFQFDELGNLVSSTSFAVNTQPIPGLGVVVGSFGTNQSVAMNNNGDVICYVLTNTSQMVLRNLSQPLARESQPSPIPGRTWKTLNVARVALNDHGDFVLSGILNAAPSTAYLIEKNGQKFAQQGDVIPALSPLPITGSNAAPIFLTNNGDVFWRTSVSDGTTVTDDAILRNFEPIVVRNRTVVNGRLVTKVEAVDSCFAVSPNGRFLVASVELALLGDALLFVDFGLVLELPGCFANPGKLGLSSGAARVGEHMEFFMDDGHVAGARPRINFSTRQRIPGSECGVVGPFGETMISNAHLIGSLFPPPWDGTNPVTTGVTIPADLALVDAVIFAQGQFRRPGTRFDRTLTNALRIEIGAP
ncbi:MAG: hypothetical protein HOP15_05925 [Planctomycetes bacterium]|nr:hypothetical protein [Planctomycetota bacterium]